MTDRTEYRLSIRRTLSDLTRQPPEDVDLHQKLSDLTATAVALIRGAACADVMVIEHGQFESLAATAPVMKELDAVQMQHGRGPCLQAAVADAVIRVPDLRADGRWPEFAAAAETAGIRSVLSFQLFTHDHGNGALNVYGRAAGEFTIQDEAIGAMLATQAATVLIASRESDDCESRLVGRDLIGQAKGILMERFHIDAARAFDIMVARARCTETPVQSIARDIVMTV